MVFYLSRLSKFYFSEHQNPLPLELEHVDEFFKVLRYFLIFKNF